MCFYLDFPLNLRGIALTPRGVVGRGSPSADRRPVARPPVAATTDRLLQPTQPWRALRGEPECEADLARLLGWLVGDLSLVAVDRVHGEADDLHAAVGEQHRVLAGHVLAVAVLHVVEHVAALLVGHAPADVVGHRHHGGASDLLRGQILASVL